MSAPLRLAMFGVLLVVVFLAGLGLGNLAGPDTERGPASTPHRHDHPFGGG